MKFAIICLLGILNTIDPMYTTYDRMGNPFNIIAKSEVRHG